MRASAAPLRLFAIVLLIALGGIVVYTAPRADAAPPAPDRNHWTYLSGPGDQYKSLAFISGALSPGGQTNNMIQYYLTSGGTTYAPDDTAVDLRNQITWTLADGYLPSPISSWAAGRLRVTVQHFVTRMTSVSASAVYSRVAISNPGPSAITTTLNVAIAGPASEVPLSGAPTTSSSGRLTYDVTVPAGGSVAKDFVAASSGKPTPSQLAASGSFDTNFAAMKSYWDGRLAALALPTQLPDPQLINLYKAAQIEIWEAIANVGGDTQQWASGGNISGRYNYNIVYGHDLTDIVGQYVRMADYATAKTILNSASFRNIAAHKTSGQFYFDSIPKFLEPFDLYNRFAADPAEFDAATRSLIKSVAHQIPGYLIGAGDPHQGLIRATNTFDGHPEYLLTDNMAVINGLQSYVNLARDWAQTDSSWNSEITWATALATSVNSAMNDYLIQHTLPRLGGYYNGCFDDCGLLRAGYQGNWLNTTLMMGALPWDGQLSGNTLGGAWSDRLQASVLGAFTKRADNGAHPPYDWGGWNTTQYGQIYNPGGGVQLLALTDPTMRNEPIAEIQWLLANQSAPMQWGESFSQGSWTHPDYDLETWGLSGLLKALLESNVSMQQDGTAVIGRGIPTEWITAGHPVSWANVPAGDGKTLGFTLTPLANNQVKLTLTGNPAGAVRFELPLFVDNIVSATAGSVDSASGSVQLPAGTTSTTVTYRSAAPAPIVVANAAAGAYTFGAAGDQNLRDQTFFATSAQSITSVQASIRKRGGSGQSALTAALYPVVGGLPVMTAPLASATVAASAVGTSFSPVTIPLSYQGLVPSRSYAIVLGQQTPGASNYEWATTGTNGVYHFGKYNSTTSTWTNENNLGDAALTVNVADRFTMSPDLSNSAAGHFSFGQSSDQVKRGQTFLATGITSLHDVRLQLRKTGGSSQSDVTVSLYASPDGVPVGSPLASAHVAAAAIGRSDTVVAVPLSHAGLIPGQRYTVVVGQQTPNTGSYYEWSTTGANGIHGFGKINPAGAWVNESRLGDAWLQVSGTLG